MLLLTFILHIYLCTYGVLLVPLPRQQGLCKISLGSLLGQKVSVHKYLFHCRECALKHYVQLVTACPALGIQESVLFLKTIIKPVKECSLVEFSSLLGQTWLHC